VLEDWPSLAECWNTFKDSPRGKQIEGGIGVFKAFFQGSLVFPTVRILVLLEEDRVRGFAILNEMTTTAPTPDGTSIMLVQHGFVRGVHIQPGVPLEQSLAMARHIEVWGVERGYPFLTGHCSPEYLSRAEVPYTRIGWYKTHTVVMKKL